jgi:hypothetical protein
MIANGAKAKDTPSGNRYLVQQKIANSKSRNIRDRLIAGVKRRKIVVAH